MNDAGTIFRGYKIACDDPEKRFHPDLPIREAARIEFLSAFFLHIQPG
jgi:hypothetical protein